MFECCTNSDDYLIVSQYTLKDMTEDTEIRNMQMELKMELINLLDMNDGWKKLMASATIDCVPTNSKKYTVDHLKLIETASKTQQKSCSELFLEEWGTSGKKRPTLKILMKLLYDIKLNRAADCIAFRLYGKNSVVSKMSEIDDSINNCYSENLKTSWFAKHLDPKFDEIKIPYDELKTATNGFSDSCLIGAGGFGEVFKGVLDNQVVAIKRMDKIVEENNVKQYCNEINNVLNFKHDNLLSLLAISCDDQPCIIYEFMENGSLFDCIACNNKSSLLNWKLRIKLGTDVARGLVYLHTAFKMPYIHRDIKTTNILLDNQMIAKIGDFGLIRQTDHTMTSNVIGTSPYMPPEAFHGDISDKVDVFSFGIVLLELLTGLKPYDTNRTNYDLLSHIQENERPIDVLLDNRAGEWNHDIVTKLYNLTMCCTAQQKTKRPTMYGQDGVFEAIENIQLNINE